MKIFFISILLLITSFFLLLRDKEENNLITTNNEKKEVVAKKIAKQSFIRKLKFSGFTEASRIVVLKSQVEGRVSSKYFNKGPLIILEPKTMYI